MRTFRFFVVGVFILIAGTTLILHSKLDTPTTPLRKYHQNVEKQLRELRQQLENTKTYVELLFNKSKEEPSAKKYIWMTSKNKPNVTKISGFILKWHNDSELVRSMKSLDKDLRLHGISGAYEAFSNVKPWAYKADIWRYAILWRHGGVYLDHECVLLEELSNIVDILTVEDPFHVCMDKGALGGIKNKLWQGFLISNAGNPKILTALKISIENVAKKIYSHPLDITGPGVMRQAALDFKSKCSKTGLGSGQLIYDYNKKPIVALDSTSKRSPYGNMFSSRTVYMKRPAGGHKISKGYTPGLDGTYAQNYQDTWFERVMKHNGWKSGFYMDLGAFKPLECSNTAMLDIKYGWSGICVEPRPDIDFKSTRNCVLVNRPMTGRTNDEVWMSSPQGKKYDPNSQLYNIRNKGVGQRMMTINAPDLIALVNKDSRISVPKFIEFVSLDVEDNEDTVLSTWPWEEYTVAVFIIENSGNSQKAKSVRKTMLEQKYFKAPVENPGVDEYWILPKFWDNSLSYKRWRIHPENSNGC